jgi:UDP-N-acetylmuramoyl-tripeptide--D-alanyl-D-alanine ligase
MAVFSFDELLTLEGACFSGKAPESQCFSISTDSRNLGPGDLYLALKGERFDGHSFVAQALRNTTLAIVERAQVEAIESALGALIDSVGLIAVPDTLAAYQGLAQLHRHKAAIKVIGITGSSGKTTTKEMTAAALGRGRRVHKSKANENNEIGVPKTILSMPDDTEVLILEMGMRGLGQIAELAACGMPDIGIITCAGSTHIELLGSRENIARAKSELLEFLDEEQGLAIIGEPAEHLMAAVNRAYQGRVAVYEPVEVVAVDGQGTAFKLSNAPVQTADEFKVPALSQVYQVRAHGLALIQDAWCAVQAALACGLSPEQVARGLADFAPVEGRGNSAASARGAVIVDESYNANPDSVRCAVEAICSQAYRQPEKIVVLGEMAELGDYTQPLHRELGQWLKDKPLSLLVTVGSIAGEIAQGAAGASFAVTAVAEQGEALEILSKRLSGNTCVMVKGSHCTNLDRLVRELHNLS